MSEAEWRKEEMVPKRREEGAEVFISELGVREWRERALGPREQDGKSQGTYLPPLSLSA